VIAPLVIGFVLLGVFIWVEWKVVSLPIIPSESYLFRPLLDGCGCSPSALKTDRSTGSIHASAHLQGYDRE
jgi:hypothetical protein